MYRTFRKRGVFPMPEVAPIAAKYEDCVQWFTRLSTALTSQSLPDEFARTDDMYGKLSTWGNESGASTRSLDYNLRKASTLRDTTLELLGTIESSLQEAVDTLPTQAIEAPLDYFTIGGHRPYSIQSDEYASEASINDWCISTLIENIEGTLTHLMRLLPSLRDPFPSDIYSRDPTVSDASEDIELASAMFPSATKSLWDRLGQANTKRRRYLFSLNHSTRHGHSFRATVGLPLPRRSPQQEIAVDAFNFQRPVLKLDTSQSKRPSSSPTRQHPVTLPSPTTLDDGSIFSEPELTRYGSITSLAESNLLVKQLVVPHPPISLEGGQSFICPYCHSVIETGTEVTSLHDWTCHVFKDLEPYMCTFDDCLRAQKTYGFQDDWFRHELESHRIMKVWICPICVTEHNTSQVFEEHLRKRHDNVWNPGQMAMMLPLCMKHSVTPLRDQSCPLCAAKLNSATVKDHIANHLEKFALTSINDNDSSDEDDMEDIISQRFDETMSEGRTKMEILNSFVEEQLGFLSGPPDKDMDQSVLDFVGDSDEEVCDEGGRHAGSEKTSDADWKLTQIQELHIGEGAVDQTAFRTVSRPRDEDFVGRNGELANLYKILSVPGRICVLSGTGGIGKTCYASEYTYRYEQSYSCIFWVQAETRVGCADTFSLIATALRLAPDGSIQEQEHLIELSKEFLENTEKRWLLVFDNVYEWSDIEEYIPRNMTKSAGSVLITSRSHGLGPSPIPPNFLCIDLKEMSMEDSRNLLLKGVESEFKRGKQRHAEWKLAGEIASLAGIPLAISHIAGYVKTSGCSFADFLELWNEWRRNSTHLRINDPLAESNVALETILDMELRELGVDALKLLKIMAFMDGDAIQRDLLVNDHTLPALQFLHSSQSFRCKRMLKELHQRRLIHVKKEDAREIVSIHRLVQQQLLQDLETNEKEREDVFSQAFELVRERLPRPSIHTPEKANWHLFKEYLPHVLSLQRVYTQRLPAIAPTTCLVELFRDAGVHLWQRGLIADALRLLNSAEVVLDQLDCEEDHLRADIHIASFLIIQHFGISHRAESKDRLAKVITIRKNLVERAGPELHSKEDEVLLYNAYADYGTSLLQYNDYREAEPIYEDCYKKYREWGTEDDIPFEYAKFNHHMAFCRMYRRDFSGAFKLSEKAIELISRQNGEIQLLLRFKFDLACIILQSGDVERSLDMQLQILKIRLTLQEKGKASYFTLQSYYAVGALYSYLGRLDEAEHYMRTALTQVQERASKGFWPEAAVARTEFHLSQVLAQKKTQITEVETLQAKARSVLSRLLPFDPFDGVREEDEGALFDHLQPVFGGRFTGMSLLKYIL